MKPWTRQQGETTKAHAAFCAYLDLGPDRSIAKALPDGASTGKRRWWEHWSSKHDWVRRAQEYDAHLFNEKLADRAQVQALALQHVFDTTSETVAELVRLARFEDPEKPSQAAKVRFAACKELLGYIGISSKSQVEVTGKVEVDAKQAAIDKVRFVDDVMNSLNLTEEQLEELDAALEADPEL